MPSLCAPRRIVGIVVCLLAASSCSSDQGASATSAQALAIAGTYHLVGIDQFPLPVDVGTVSTDPSAGTCDLFMDSATLTVTDRGGNSGDFKFDGIAHQGCKAKLDSKFTMGGSTPIAKQGSVDYQNNQFTITQPSGGDVQITGVTVGNQGGLHLTVVFLTAGGRVHEMTMAR